YSHVGSNLGSLQRGSGSPSLRRIGLHEQNLQVARTEHLAAILAENRAEESLPFCTVGGARLRRANGLFTGMGAVGWLCVRAAATFQPQIVSGFPIPPKASGPSPIASRRRVGSQHNRARRQRPIL